MNKKILFLLMTLFVVLPAKPMSICAKDSIVSIVLDPSISGTGTPEKNTSLSTWKVHFPYGSISGLSACLNEKGDVAYQTSPVLMATGGENTGSYCWCKMIHPMNSLWAFNPKITNGGGGACNTACPHNCAYVFQSDYSLRKNMFDSVSVANDML